MINELLVNLVNKVLGTGKRTARGNQAHHCPFCNHHKKKLEINFSQHKRGLNPWHCWVCNKKGNRISTLFKKVNASPEHYQKLIKLIGEEKEYKKEKTFKALKLPKEFTSILNNSDISARHALSYLKRRGLTIEDIKKYNIGFCPNGSYANMVIIPSYDETGELNYFTGRSYQKDPYIKYRNPECSRDIIPFGLFINWDLPLVLCEGPFDAMAIKRNAIPLLGKNIQSKLLKKIITSSVKKIYIALDTDAKKQSLNFAEKFLNEGKEVYFVELEGKDPSDLGFAHFTNLIQNTYPMSYSDLMEKKISLI